MLNNNMDKGIIQLNLVKNIFIVLKKIDIKEVTVLAKLHLFGNFAATFWVCFLSNIFRYNF